MSDANHHLKLYEEYNKSLRTWFLSFGIGAVVLLISNADLAAKFAKSPEKTSVVTLFLIGCAIQVAIAFVNKVCSWCMYNGDLNEEFTATRYYKIADAVNSWFWLDVLLDLATIILFGVAIYKTADIFL